MKEESKIAKRLRLILIFLFTMITLCLSMPFGSTTVTYEGHTAQFAATGFDLIFSVQLTGELGAQVLIFAIFLIIPVTCFLAACFDTKRNVKNILSLVGSIIGITMITFYIGPRMCIGAFLSMLLYLCTFVVAMLSILVKYSENKEPTVTVQSKTVKKIDKKY